MAALNVTQKLINDHLIEGELIPGKEIGIKIDQALLQDATGTLVQLELEAMGLDRAKTEVAVQYVDHNLLQTDFKNADDHLFLKSAAQRFGLWFSRPGNGVSHPVHMERFGKPGKTLVGSDSHSCAAGSLGMLAIGTGGLDVAAAIAGQPYYVKMPKVMGVKLTGNLPDWVSAKDIILEMLRRHDVKGGVGKIIEYYGDGLKHLSAMDRHVIANMGAELGATTTVFPSDEETKRFLKSQTREEDWIELKADEGCEYDLHDEIVLDDLVPLIALPTSPGNVVPVSEVAGKKISQCVIGSSANPGLRDFWIAGEIVKGKAVNAEVSLDINPTSRQIIQNMIDIKTFGNLITAGARFHQSGCMGCIGMGQAPASGTISLRTMPRNFPDRSGTKDDQVHLCSPETAAASALTGKITDPRDMEKLYDMNYPEYVDPEIHIINTDMLVAPPEDNENVELQKGPNIKSLPHIEELKDSVEVPVLLKMGDNISTDEILKAGAEVLPLRSNLPEISKYAFTVIDETYYDRAMETKDKFGGHIVVAAENYAQGSSREHAAIAPKYLGQVAVIAKSYARIAWQNLVNFGILPLEFENLEDYDKFEQGDTIKLKNLRASVKNRDTIEVEIIKENGDSVTVPTKHTMSDRQIRVLLKGGIINDFKEKLN
ncbi:MULTISPECIES: aconitate hydratase [Mesonia]|uniref:Homoaconitase large subunit n=1 Tax=Mesonia oceanica TaxID=2687242 RepID=A0AC61Y4S9_9FLAO|nr:MULTISPECIES: aconitate hydratase [Mesonia]MAN26584.1 aconitate hydratase [Mesonia sp.]MAQ40852.1 aconitate hydratase [Mesonia sp.]MBJ97773.1 aconitate hydratase [Flavobacteriaceae bacterium]VVU99481.1 Homoaconitase large subunit [Mesonia oceanica]|tara:strand:- start:8029 stop:9996 length:1968 start_codon:yes stop_codon:yes gene_type:complete